MTTSATAPTGAPNGELAGAIFPDEELVLAGGSDDRVDRILESLARLDERVGHIAVAVDRTPSRDEVAELRRRLESLEGDRAKLVWLVLTAVITAALSIVVQVGQ